MGGVVELSALILVLGAKGFTKGGLPFSSRTKLTGARGRAVGAMAIFLGLAGLGLAYWESDPATRKRLETLGQGIVCGILGTLAVFGEAFFRVDAEEVPQVRAEDGDQDPSDEARQA